MKPRLMLCALGVFCWLAGAVALRADPTADKIADVQAKIAALEPIVMQDAPPSMAGNSTPPSPPPPAPTTTPPGTNAPASMPPTPNPPAPAVNVTTTQNRGTNRVLSYFLTLRASAQREDYSNAITAANNLAGADPRAEIQHAVAALLPELQQLRDARQAVVDAQIKDLSDQVTKAILAAKDPKDLDAIVQGVDQSATKARTQMRGMDGISAMQQIEEVSRYAKNWQRYLSDASTGNAQQAQNDLRMLSDMASGYAPIPRSQLLALEQAAAGDEVQPIDVKIELRTLDDIPAAINKLQDAQPAAPQPGFVNGPVGMIMGGGNGIGSSNPALNILINALESLQNSSAAYAAKDYPGALKALDFPFFSELGIVALSSTDKVASGAVRKQIIELKEGLLCKIAQGLLATPGLPDAQAGEHAGAYLARLAAAKAKAADWTGLQQVLTVSGQVAGPGDAPPGLQEDMDALRAYLIGEKLEAAGQTLDAIRSYRQSLATLGKFFPADPPAAKLKDLAAKFPDLYQQALQQPIAKAQ